MAKMTQETFRTLLEHEITEANSWAGSGIRGEQRRNLAYYLGLPLGNEVDGRSQVVSWDVFETVEGACSGQCAYPSDLDCSSASSCSRLRSGQCAYPSDLDCCFLSLS